MLNHSENVQSGSDELQTVDDTCSDGTPKGFESISLFCKTHKLSYL
jgi:hypothetical protein